MFDCATIIHYDILHYKIIYYNLLLYTLDHKEFRATSFHELPLGLSAHDIEILKDKSFSEHFDTNCLKEDAHWND